MTGEPVNRLHELLAADKARAEEEKRRKLEDERFRAQCERRAAKIEAWALRQPSAEVAASLATAVVLAMEWRKTSRLLGEVRAIEGEVREEVLLQLRAAEHTAREFGRYATEARAARKRGAAVKAVKSGMAAKKAEVERAWAASSKRGRGAKTRFITAQAALHDVSPRTIEKWIGGK